MMVSCCAAFNAERSLRVRGAADSFEGMNLRLAALCLALTSGAVCAQDFFIPVPRQREIVLEERIETKPTIEGIVKDVFVTKKPWQLINPAAPAKYGSGQKNVSKDFGPGTPFKSTGWIVAGVEW